MIRIISKSFSTARMATVTSSPFTQAVVEAMRKLYVLHPGYIQILILIMQ